MATATSREQLLQRLDELESQLESSNLSQKGVNLDNFEKSRLRLRQTASTAHSVVSSVELASQVADGVESRVNGALELYERAKSARLYVESVLSLRSSLAVLHDAMDTKQWERAAQAARTALDLPNELRSSELALKMVPSQDLPEEPNTTLKSACDALGEFFLKQFDISSAARDTASLTRWFKLLPLVDHADQGIAKYSRFVAGIVAGSSRNLLTEGSRDNSSLYGIAMARLFESIAAILDQHSRLVESSYGNRMPQVIEIIQNEADSQAGLIVDTWYDERRIDVLLDEIKGYIFPVLQTNLGFPTEGSCDIDFDETLKRLAELHLMISRWELYCDFLGRWDTVKTLEECALKVKVDEILRPSYSKLAVFVFRRCIEKCIEEEVLGASSTNMPDDISIVLSTLVNQGANKESLIRVLHDWVKVVERRIKQRRDVLIYLNDLETVSMYCEKIVGPATDKLNERIDQVTSAAVRAHFSLLEPDLASICTAVFKGPYLMSSVDPESTRGSEFEAAWAKFVAPLSSLNTVSYHALMKYATKYVAKMLLNYVLSLEAKVNDLGAIALDRDVSRVISVTCRSNYSLRANYDRVSAVVNFIETGEDCEDSEQASKLLV